MKTTIQGVVCDSILTYIYIMKHISILVPETAIVEAIADPRYMFTAVNQFLQAEGKSALFNVQLVGTKKEIRLAKDKDLGKELLPNQQIRCFKDCQIELLLCTGSKVYIKKEDGWGCASRL